MASRHSNWDTFNFKGYRTQPRYSLDSEADSSEPSSPIPPGQPSPSPGTNKPSNLRNESSASSDSTETVTSTQAIKSSKESRASQDRRESKVRCSFGPEDILDDLRIRTPPRLPSQDVSMPSIRTEVRPDVTMLTVGSELTLRPGHTHPAEDRRITQFYDAKEWLDKAPDPDPHKTANFLNPIQETKEEDLGSETEVATEHSFHQRSFTHHPTSPDIPISSQSFSADLPTGTDPDHDSVLEFLRDPGPPPKTSTPRASPLAKVTSSQAPTPTCTATYADTLRLKAIAQRLLIYEESNAIIGDLIERIERMADKDSMLELAQGTKRRSLKELAGGLRSFLYQTKTGRVCFGEDRRVVVHQLDWADWLMEAVNTEVVHFPGEGCVCKREWSA